MALGGGSAPQPPAPQPQVPVPQDDDPKSMDSQRATAIAAKNREGYSAHLLSGSGTDPAMGSDPLGAKRTTTASMME